MIFKENLFSGKIILITGGGSGLGLAMARGFAELGGRVFICGRTEEKLVKAVEELEKIQPLHHRYAVVDVRDAAQVEQWMNEIFESEGKAHVLINNAAGNFLSFSEKLTPNAFKTVVDIVLLGTFYASLYFARNLIEKKLDGCIINIVTTYAETGSAFVLPSAAAKAGVLAMTRSLAYEWADYHIRVNAIAPGPFPTEGAWSRLSPDPSFQEKYLRHLPLHRFGRMEELVQSVIFLASDAASYITGENLTVDGGEHLRSGQFNLIKELYSRDQLEQFFSYLKDLHRSKKK